jgi:hypothetical protein
MKFLVGKGRSDVASRAASFAAEEGQAALCRSAERRSLTGDVPIVGESPA